MDGLTQCQVCSMDFKCINDAMQHFTAQHPHLASQALIKKNKKIKNLTAALHDVRTMAKELSNSCGAVYHDCDSCKNIATRFLGATKIVKRSSGQREKETVNV